MNATILGSRATRGLLGGMALLVALTATGCQVDVGGQTLPSGYYLTDDVQYFAPGPQQKLAREAAAQRAYREEQALRTNNGNGNVQPPP